MKDIELRLKSKLSEEREEALDFIGENKPENAFELILSLLDDPSEEVRESVMCNMGEINDPRTIPVLKGIANSEENEKVRSEALESLAMYKGADIKALFIQEAKKLKKSRRPRQIIAKALSEYDCAESVATLIYLYDDDDVYVKFNVVDSLLMLNRTFLRYFWEKILKNETHEYLRKIAQLGFNSLEEKETSKKSN